MFLSYSQERCLEQLVKDKGHTPCHICESQRVGVDEYASDWASGGSLQVVTKCSDCGAGGSFIISPEEARNSGLEPDENPPIHETL
jgi:hypothetical protein